MQISGYGAVNQSLWPTEQNRRATHGHQKSSNRADTVSFSDEALALLEQLQRVKSEAAEKQAKSALSKNEDEKSGQSLNEGASHSPEASENMKAQTTGTGQSDFGDTTGEHSEAKTAESSVHKQNKAAAGSSSSTDTIESIETQIEKLKGKIKELAETMNKILSNETIPLETREQMVKPIEEQINQLMAQISQLESKKEQIAQQQKTKLG